MAMMKFGCLKEGVMKWIFLECVEQGSNDKLNDLKEFQIDLYALNEDV